MLVVLGGRGAEELGDDLDREDAVDPPSRVDHGSVLRLALEQVGERIAHDVVAIEDRPQRRVGPLGDEFELEVATGEPPDRAPLIVDQQRVGDFGVGELRP